MAEQIRVLLTDDHPVVRQGLKTFLDIQPDMTVVAEAGDGAEALRLISQLKPDVVLLDLKLPDMHGHEVLRELARRGAEAKVIVLTSAAGVDEVAPAVRSGASGFLYKDVDPDALAQAIRTVHDGQMLFAPQAAAAMVNGRDDAAPRLTDRERQVLRLVAAGRSNREIARQLLIQEKTVKTHMSSLMRKLGVSDRTQAAVYAVHHGLSEDAT